MLGSVVAMESGLGWVRLIATATAVQPTTAAKAAVAPVSRPQDTRPSVPAAPARIGEAGPACLVAGQQCQAAGMVVEVADIEVSPGAEEDFANAFRGVRDVLVSTPGCRSVRMTRGVETPARFVLLVEWESVAAHEQNFRATERFAQWRAAISPFFARPPHVEHFTDL